MSKHEIDIMWQKAMRQSIEEGEMFTRYHFAKLVAERALADSMREVQRLGQEIEQEPEVDLRTRWPMNGWKENKSTPPQRTEPVISKWSLREVYFDEDGEPLMHRSPPQRTWVGLTDEEIEELMDNYDVASPDYAKVIEAKLKEKNT